MLDASKIDFSGQKYLADGPSSAGGIVSLEGIEEVLAEHAEKLGVEIRRGTPVTDFTQSEDGVTVQAGDESFHGKMARRLRRWPQHSTKTRRIRIRGHRPEFTGYSAWVDIADPEKLHPVSISHRTACTSMAPVQAASESSTLTVPRSIARRRLPSNDLQAILRRVSGTDVTLTNLHVATSYTDRARQATTYRKGRVLLAGDAAHIHSPLGGQGLNTGLGDAMNLGWKLAATIKGWAPDNLLDTYTAERHPVGAWAVNWTRAQVAIMRPDPHARAIAAVIRDLINTKDGTSYFVEKISGVLLRYDLPGDHPLIGRSAPDFEFEDGSRLGPLLHDGTSLLLDFAAKEEINTLSQRWNGRVKYVAAKPKDNKDLTALLIRPDGFVAWATDSDPDLSSLEATMHRWLGSVS